MADFSKKFEWDSIGYLSSCEIILRALLEVQGLPVTLMNKCYLKNEGRVIFPVLPPA